MKIKSHKDFYSGLMFFITGTAFGIGATTYNIGDGARMGPGYFPLMLGVVMALMGIAITVTSVSGPDREVEEDLIGSVAWKPLGYIIGANVAFGVLLGGLPKIGVPAMGMIVGIYGLTFIASLAGDDFRLKEVFLLSTVLAVFSYVGFVWLLKLQFPVWPSFITG